jgi:hypothetical protein
MRKKGLYSLSAKIAAVVLSGVDLALYLYTNPIAVYCVLSLCGRLEPISRQELWPILGMLVWSLLIAVPTALVWLITAIYVLQGKPFGSPSFIRAVWVSIVLQPILFLMVMPIPAGVADYVLFAEGIRVTIFVNALLHGYIFWRITHPYSTPTDRDAWTQTDFRKESLPNQGSGE